MQMSAGFAGAGAAGYGTGFAAGGFAAGAETVHRTHCVQQAQIELEQPVTISPYVSGRPRDVVGSLVTGLGGFSILAGAVMYDALRRSSYDSDYRLYQS